MYVTHIFDGLSDWCDHVLYLHDDGIEETSIEKIKDKDIYSFILDKFNKEKVKILENETSNISNINIGNAGGYANGTLNNFSYNK